jgi:hypothetical protein
MKTTTLYNIASNKQSNGASASWVVKFIFENCVSEAQGTMVAEKVLSQRN